MRFLFAFCFIALSASATQAQAYVPFTIDEATYKQLQTYLGDQPAKFSTPLINWLSGAEVQAQANKAAADKAFEQKPPETKKENDGQR